MASDRAARAVCECKAAVIDFPDQSPVAARAMDTAYRALRRLHGQDKAVAMVVQKSRLCPRLMIVVNWSPGNDHGCGMS